MGAAGALEALFTISSPRNRRLPPTLNLGVPDAAAATLDLVREARVAGNLSYAMTNSFGFGGVNASAVVRRQPSQAL